MKEEEGDAYDEDFSNYDANEGNKAAEQQEEGAFEENPAIFKADEND